MSTPHAVRVKSVGFRYVLSRKTQRRVTPSLEHLEGRVVLSTIAFSRYLFEPHGVEFSPAIIRARGDGRIETDVPLMSIPAYTRARALAVQLHESMPEDEFQSLCLYNAEANAILKAVEAAGAKLDLTKLKLYPCIVPDRDVSDQTMEAAMTTLNAMIERNRAVKKKPWWKFWK